MKKLFGILGLLLISACHPLIMFSPKPMKSVAKPDAASAEKSEKIRITVDNMGLPYIKASSIHDVMYGLGFMHARDRLFQLDMMRHAALGRTAELFGERTLTFDRKLRILSYRLDEQIANLSPTEDLLLDYYVRGVNDGAKQRGRTAEHFVLGAQFEEFTKRDVVAIARLQSWQLGSDLHAEFTRLHIARANVPADIKQELLSSMDDRGSAIITNTSRFAEKLNLPSYLTTMPTSTAPRTRQVPSEDVVQTTGGASNAWVINGALSKDGRAMLMNDPHLQHSWPSNFYLATLEAPDLFVTGATFVGLPGILIGATKELSWGVTASCLNTQDAVLLKMAEGDDKAYVFDGKKMAFTEWPQRFCTNKKGACTDAMFYTSVFGPVVDNAYDRYIDKGDRLAVQWTGFAIEQHKDPSGGFLTLAGAHNVQEGIDVIKTMTLPGVNLVLADTLGNIGYSYAGLIPRRDETQHPYLPLDGSLSSSKWSDFKYYRDEPSTVNPATGYIITANQNIFNSDAHPALGFGKQGSPPYRALRIKERIEGMLKDNAPMDFDALSEVQLDDTSTEAKELAQEIGNLCVEQFANADGYRQSFARAVSKFDGRYAKESIEALPYEMLINEIVEQRLRAVLGDMAPETFGHVSQTRYTIKNALWKQLQGQKTAIFASVNTDDDVKMRVKNACEPAYQKIVKRAGKSQSSWRWGRHHYLQRQSPLGKAPFFGGLFRDRRREVSGSNNAPMAESGLPVMYGANLRFRVKMTTPPEIFAVIDSGNSGTVGHKNAFDQAMLWHDGKSIPIDTDWNAALKKSKSYFELDKPLVSAKK